jgi:hypothetical protein
VSGPVEQPPEPVRIDVVGVGVEPVPAPFGGDLDSRSGTGQHASDAGDVAADGLLRVVRWIIVPQQIDEPGDRYRTADLQQQDPQQAAFVAARQCQHLAVTCVHLDRTEHVEPHVRTLVAPASPVATLLSSLPPYRAYTTGPEPPAVGTGYGRGRP